MKLLHLTILFTGLIAAQDVLAQRKLVDRRDQAEGWYVPIRGEVMAQGRKTGDFEVVLYRENEEAGSIHLIKGDGKFELELDIDQFYAIRILKNGFQEKLIYVDTNLPEDLVVYPDYFCYVDLLPLGFDRVDQFYTDFPSAMVRYDPVRGGFYHNEEYLGHIQQKLMGLARANF